MNLDMRTLILAVGVVHLFQFMVFLSLFRMNKNVGGLRYWLLWSVCEVAGFTFMLLRDLPGLFKPVVIMQNTLIIGGIFFLMMGISGFLTGKYHKKASLAGFLLFYIPFLWFLFVNDNIDVRGIIINFFISAVSIAIAYLLFRNEIKPLRNITRILGVTFVIHALVFIYRGVLMITDHSISSFFMPYLGNLIPVIDAFLVSLLWTFGLFLMVNKRLHHEKEVHRHYFETVFYSSPDPSIITNVDAGKIIDCNNAFLCNFGYTREEVIGKTTLETGLWVDLELRNKLIEKVLSEGTLSNYETEFRTISGEIRNCLLSSTIIKSVDENVMLSVVTDVTELRIVQEEIRRSEERYRLLTETTPDFVLLHDLQFNLLYINNSALKILGFTREEVTGKSLSIIIPESYMKQIGDRKNRRIDGDFGIMNYTLEVTKKDGSLLPVEVRSAPIIRNGTPENFVIVARDVTEQLRQLEELRNAKEKAEEMNQLKSHFFANMNHELRTPFVGILGFAQILAETVKDPDALEMVKSITNGARRLTDTLDKILSLAQLDFNEVRVASEEIGVNNIINEVVAYYKSEAILKDITVSFEPMPGDPVFFSDRKIVYNILDKLVSNAIKYTNEGDVTISADILDSPDDSVRLVVSVKDSGIGIEPEKQELIWLPFRQASEGRGRSFEGTGLGLSITKRFVELLGGKISLNSMPGTGSIFTFSIPVNKSFSPELQLTSKEGLND